MTTLPDGGHYTDADYLATTEEFQHHLVEVREMVESYLKVRSEKRNGSSQGLGGSTG
ncbi:MAG: hypothetical protein AAF481_05510 [Acidobacteriota bacterium]